MPVHWKGLECIFTKSGFVFDRQKGDHRCYEKENVLRPVIIPMYDDVGLDNIKRNMRTANMDRETYLKLLEECK
jgi:predicted RNA binding protein YcfA (HicA-like mRNA interferase family)